jgi:hypothetical protein
MPIYKKFVINNNLDYESKRNSKKIVDNFFEFFDDPNKILLIDVARITSANCSAAQLIYKYMYLFYKRNYDIINLKKIILISNNAHKLSLNTNNFDSIPFNNGSKIRCLVHGGLAGFLAVRLCISPYLNNTTLKNTLHIIKRCNNKEKACNHIKWSIKEFNLLFNIGILIYKTESSPFNDLTEDESIKKVVILNTIENQNEFINRCNNRHHLYQYRIIGSIKEYYYIDPNIFNINKKINIPIIDEWGSTLVTGLVKILGIKMKKFNYYKNGALERGLYVIEIFKFIIDHMLWIFNSDYYTQIMNLTKLRKVIIERAIYLANEGLEHAAYFFCFLYPKMMTSKIYLNVRLTHIYNMSELWIYHNKDPIFGPMKVALRKLMPNGENRCII